MSDENDVLIAAHTAHRIIASQFGCDVAIQLRYHARSPLTSRGLMGLIAGNRDNAGNRHYARNCDHTGPSTPPTRQPTNRALEHFICYRFTSSLAPCLVVATRHHEAHPFGWPREQDFRDEQEEQQGVLHCNHDEDNVTAHPCSHVMLARRLRADATHPDQTQTPSEDVLGLSGGGDIEEAGEDGRQLIGRDANDKDVGKD
mmetsp:Transcript_36596/g.72906  ORF Transcript_36596/g.72906 Transcript_36596/m.72906 type:complete len:201 (+) Transcript_36596:675-1277(+)